MADILTTVHDDLWALVDATPGPVQAFVDSLGLATPWPSGMTRYKVTDGTWARVDKASDDVSLRVVTINAAVTPGGLSRQQVWNPLRVTMVGRLSKTLGGLTLEKLYQFAIATLNAVDAYRINPGAILKIVGYELALSIERNFLQFTMTMPIRFEHNIT